MLFSEPDASNTEEYQEWKDKVYWIEHLVLMVNHRGDCLIDEVHQGLLLKNRLNFTLGASQTVPKSITHPILELYQFFGEVSLDEIEGINQKGLKMTELLKAYKPIQSEAQ